MKSFFGRSIPCEFCKIEDALPGRGPLRFQRADYRDPRRLEQVEVLPFTDAHAEQGAIIHIQDIMEQKQKDNELILADKLISLGTLVSGVAHEINNPNNFIMLNAPIVMDAWKSIEPIIENYYKENGDFVMGGLTYSEMRSELPGLLSGILEGSRRIERIVRDLKSYARHDTVGEHQLVDVNKVIESSVRILNSIIRKASDHFSADYGENLPLINGDAQKLEQVMINLIQNACQALTNKEQHISIQSSYNKEEDGIVIEVRDEGVGISAETIPSIMDPFFTTKRSYGGTGLGLAVCSKIVMEHQGKIDIKSREGAGSTFSVFLPVIKKRKRARILVVDDDDFMRESMVNMLQSSEHYQVQKASNGAEAFLLMGHQLPELLILDIHMPDMDGLEVCRLLKEREELAEVRVVVVTGFPDSDKVKKVLKLGFTTLIPKPFTMTDFMGTVEKVLEGGPVRGLKQA